jgi:hypothetical protein
MTTGARYEIAVDDGGEIAEVRSDRPRPCPPGRVRGRL